MGRQEELIETYAADLRDRCGMEPDLDLLAKVTAGCGPSIYDDDAAVVSSSDTEELNRVRESFLMGKLGLEDSESLMGAIQEAIRTYGRENPRKYRAVIYYMLTKRFGREEVYN
ncbi:DUF2853 family protein [Palleronia sp. LCG004]|uniref:DUF2853 family protein n=1 Tax=Palleronia sp. LCG004 TaxID=3079304 RepID=UPI002941FFFD|nr:DUF2853 family protein [Palleronia sp. LCG004]WOI55915.1 DUF2853 family protein [Palleronia sp. LCG004]